VLLSPPSTFAINIAAPMAVIVSGSQFAKIERFCAALHIQCMSRQAHLQQQKLKSYPAIRFLAKSVQDHLFTGLRDLGQSLVLKDDAQVWCV
jgi:hypothetical protein